MKKDEPNVAKWMNQSGENQNGLDIIWLYLRPEPKMMIMANVRVKGTAMPIARERNARLAWDFFVSCKVWEAMWKIFLGEVEKSHGNGKDKD